MYVGVDGCHGGWLVVAFDAAGPGAARATLAERFTDVLEIAGPDSTIAVDIPIGLPEIAGPGGRLCDVEARARLGGRQSAVFGVPSRATVMCTDYAEACRVNLAHSDPPKKVSKQCFHIFPKIREVDAALTPALQRRVVEVHPELAFRALNGGVPMASPKKVKSRPNPDGLADRAALLRAAGFCDAVLAARPWRRRDVGPDDLLDACANALMAARIARGAAQRLPVNPTRDARGLRMEHWA